jgi:hypothetical protein
MRVLPQRRRTAAPAEGAFMIYDVNDTRADTGPTIVESTTQRTRRSDLAMRVAYATVSAIIVSLLWIVSGSATPSVKAWSVLIGVSMTAAVLAGHAVVETARMQRQLAASEAMITTMAHTVAAQAVQAAAHADSSKQSDAPRSHRRPARRRRRRTTGDTGQLISDEFQIFLRGRESRFEDGPDPLG